MAGEKTLYLEIPLAEFEFLHAEVKRLREGWSDAEAQIAVLRDALNHANVELAHRVGWEERALDAEAAVATLRAQVIRLERDIERFYEDERAKKL